MKILITCARAPVSIEWIKIAQKNNHSITMIDSMNFPLGRFMKNIAYIKIPSPKLNPTLYKKTILQLAKKHDLIIPLCEDIFYLTGALSNTIYSKKIFAPPIDTLLKLHNKATFHKSLNSYIKIPKTKILTSHKDIKKYSYETVLKPVFSRFGSDVIYEDQQKNINPNDFNKRGPWVQQEFISGTYICNYALIVNGHIITHVTYRPKYLINNAASTYFQEIKHTLCTKFIKKFAKDTEYNGQIAFDFIENSKGLYVIECNPRATSGLHLVSKNITLTKNGLIKSERSTSTKACRVGDSLLFMFGLKSLRQKNIRLLISDFKSADNVISKIPRIYQVVSLLETLYIKIKYHITFTEATTFDIEYNHEK